MNQINKPLSIDTLLLIKAHHLFRFPLSYCYNGPNVCLFVCFSVLGSIQDTTLCLVTMFP